MDFGEAVAELDGRLPNRIEPGLERIAAVCDLLDHPERTYPSVHVAGTNGKTTTARLVGRILCAHGLAAGIYTSPHLATVRERLTLCDESISEEDFAEVYAHLLPVLRTVDGGGPRVSYFEVLTALAFLWFADKPVDAAVLEVGMGGSWDATNLVRGEVAVICPVGLDHPELGSTVAEVAGEKAGIIKEGATVVVREQDPQAMAVLEARAHEVGADLLVEGRDFALDDRVLAVGGQRLRVRGLRGAYDDLTLPLHGDHQARNAAAAVVAAEVLMGREAGEDPLHQALAGASSPGRIEVVARRPLVVVDGAHNPDGAEALAAAIGEVFLWDRLHLVLGVLEGKDVRGIVVPLASRADAAYACPSSSPRSLPASRTAEVCRAAGIPTVTEHPTVDAALDAALGAAGEDDIVLVTGSLYTVADARSRYPKD